MKNINKQKGIALVMSLIMLLLITIIGVASVRMSNLDTQTSGNSMFSLVVFQGAESALSKVATNDDISNIRDAALDKSVPVQVPASYFPTETVNDGIELSSKAEIAFENDFPDGLFSGLPNSVGVGGSAVEFQVYRTTAESKLDATAAKAIHIQGIAISKASQ